MQQRALHDAIWRRIYCRCSTIDACYTLSDIGLHDMHAKGLTNETEYVGKIYE